MGDVTLREIDEHNRAEVEELRVSEAQQRFVDGVAASLREAAGYSPGPRIRGFRPTGEYEQREAVLKLDLQ